MSYTAITRTPMASYYTYSYFHHLTMYCSIAFPYGSVALTARFPLHSPSTVLYEIGEATDPSNHESVDKASDDKPTRAATNPTNTQAISRRLTRPRSLSLYPPSFRPNKHLQTLILRRCRPRRPWTHPQFQTHIPRSCESHRSSSGTSTLSS